MALQQWFTARLLNVKRPLEKSVTAQIPTAKQGGMVPLRTSSGSFTSINVRAADIIVVGGVMTPRNRPQRPHQRLRADEALGTVISTAMQPRYCPKPVSQK
jgi:hypothetical protein